MALANTIWPSDLPASQALKDWLSLLYATVDSKSESSGDRLAGLFADNGIMYGMQGKATGRQEISASRKSAWTTISSRKHDILRVYTGNPEFSDILIIGNLTAELHNGNKVETEFIAQIQLEGMAEEKPKGKLYKVWGDSAPWVKAMQANGG